jgi:hypothetical protein
MTKMPPDEIREQIKAVEACFDRLSAAEGAIPILNAEIAAEHAFSKLVRIIYDYFRKEEG